MSTSKEQLEAIQDIRKMMQESSKFLSLSGFSGVFAGIFALCGAWIGKMQFDLYFKDENLMFGLQSSEENLMLLIFSICVIVLLASISVAFYFSKRKANKSGAKLFDKTTGKLLFNMAIPLLAGGIFCLAILYHGGTFVFLVAPTMLIFYGLALLNGSKYTYHEIKILGLLEISLGIVALFLLGKGLLFWTLGFGLLHIIYGTLVWYKHERK
ncbi:MAG: hypothetical protein V4622_13700 [Bacteroidota bacterium]